MINPPQVLPEEPTAVTPHGGFCGGKSQQWLRYPTSRTSGSVRAKAEWLSYSTVTHLGRFRGGGPLLRPAGWNSIMEPPKVSGPQGSSELFYLSGA
jgi:hypothetical protein